MVDFNVILESVCERLESIGVKMFLHTRPQAILDKLDEFVLVEFASGIRTNVYGEDNTADDFCWDSTSVAIEIFVKDKTKAQNFSEASTKRVSELLSQAIESFPCKDYDRGIEMCKPRVLSTCTSDGEGFHYARINMRVTTLVDSD